MKLHLGCGAVHLDGWVNVDRMYQPSVDLVDDIGARGGLRSFASGSIEETYSCHAIDHYSRWEYPLALAKWFELLKPGGRIRLSMPSFEWVVLNYQRTGDLRSMIGQLYAGQNYGGNCRQWIWDLEMARADLEAAGFVDVEPFEPFADDASQLKDEIGQRRSLNVQARRP